MLVKLGNVLKVQHGYAFKSEHYVEHSQYRLVTLGNFTENNSFKFNDAKATYYGAEFPSEFILSENDLILPLTEQVIGLFGNTALVPKTEGYTFVLNQRVGKIICDETKVDKVYLHYLLATESVKKQLEARASGTRQRNISPENIYDVTVNLPSIDVQRKIGSILKSIEDQIERNSAMVKRLQVLAQTIYYRWFIQFEYPNANVELAYNNELKRQTPVGWEVKKLSEVCKINLGGTPKTDIKEYWNGNIHWLNSGEVANFPVVTSELMITESGVENSATKLLKAGTTIVSITGNIRASFLAIDSCANQSVVGIEENDLYKVGYIYPFIDNLLAHFTRSSTGNCQKHINKGAIEDAKILIPPQKIMHEYNALVQRIYNEIKETSLMTLSLTSLKNKLLPLLINQQLL